MRLEAECYPCMMSQAFRAARLSGMDGEDLRAAMRETSAILERVDPSSSPPAAAELFYGRIQELSGVADPFHGLKEESNEKALALLPRLRHEAGDSPDPLVYALRAAVAGNIMDFGAHANPADLEENLHKVLARRPFIDDTEELRLDLAQASSALLVCDNAGEIVLDRLLCDVISSLVYPVITTGLAMAGVELERCSPHFREVFAGADVILAKGQGNFETLDAREENIYLLFQVKCDCVSGFLRAKKGEAVIWSLRKGRAENPR
jgi:uncharacterized protein with ATP-grasp and redox domains